MPAYKPPGNPKKVTPTDWKGPPDARDTGGEYPNYYIKKTRSGHVFMMDDTKESEHITFQHRSGTMIQMLPDGSIGIAAQNGMYNIVFGENRMLITGAYDITVNGGGSLSVDGDYNVTVKGNYNTTVHGDMNMTVKNLNQTVRGNMDVAAKNMSMKVEGNTDLTTHGITAIGSDGGLALSSTGDSVAVTASKRVAVKSGAETMLQSKGKMHMKSGGAMNMSASNKLSLQGSAIAADGSGGVPNILFASGESDPADEAEAIFADPAQPEMEDDTETIST